MHEKELKALKKELKKAPNQDGIIDWIYGAYIDGENNVLWKECKKFDELEDDEKFRHLAIITKSLSTFHTNVEQSEIIRDLNNEDEDGREDTMQEIMDLFISEHPHTDPYYISATRILFDIPTRASDGAILEDENSVFDSIIFSACPAKLSAPTLGFEDGVTELSRRWVIGSPKFGFMYPSLDEGAANLNEVSLLIKKDEGRNFLESLFKLEDIQTEEDQKESWTAILSNVGVTAEEASVINETIAAHEETTVDQKTLEKIIEESGVSTNRFNDIYESIADGKEFTTSAISEKKMEICTDSAKIQVPADKAAFVKTQKVNGVEYIMIPVDGIVKMNGTEILLKE